MATVRRGKRPGRCGRRRCIDASAAALSVASTEEKRQRRRPGLLPAWILSSHNRMLPDQGSKGNPDPSRALAPAGTDTPVAGRDGPAVLPDSADGGSWRSAVAGDVLRHGKRGCNSVVRDHNADRSRTRHDIRCRGRPAGGEPFHHEPSLPATWRGWTTATDGGTLGPALMCGDLSRLPKPEPRCLRQRGSILISRLA